MSYGYVWIIIGAAQWAFLLFIGVLQYVRLDQRRGYEGKRVLENRSVQRQAASHLWWRRLQAARWLSATADGRDRGIIHRLLLDRHPGVQSAATSSLLRYADEDLISLILERLASRSTAVRLYQAGVLRQCSQVTVPLLLDRLRADVAPEQLHAYISLAASLDSLECVERVATLSTHQNAEVRVAVAKALQRFNNESSVIKLLTMLRDPDWRVRAQAARGLGVLHDERAIQDLLRALRDQTWWVRFRAGLALAALGDPGRAALDGARELSDRYARDMAAFVMGLSASSVTELSEG
jgi:HEAT repeat protein